MVLQGFERCRHRLLRKMVLVKQVDAVERNRYKPFSPVLPKTFVERDRDRVSLSVRTNDSIRRSPQRRWHHIPDKNLKPLFPNFIDHAAVPVETRLYRTLCRSALCEPASRDVDSAIDLAKDHHHLAAWVQRLQHLKQLLSTFRRAVGLAEVVGQYSPETVRPKLWKTIQRLCRPLGLHYVFARKETGVAITDAVNHTVASRIPRRSVLCIVML